MPSKTPYTANPFASPTKDSPAITDADITPQQPNILATANLLLDQLKELETLCSTVEARVQLKRQTLKELEKLVAATTTEAPSPSPTFSANTPISRRLRLKSPRLRGLFDLRGPGNVNPVALQSALDYSPKPQGATNLQAQVSVRDSEEAGQAVEEPEGWEDDDDDDDEAPLCPFDDKYALPGSPTPSQSPLNVEKALPPTPIEKQDVQTTKIPKLYLKRRVSTSKYLGSRAGTVARVPSGRRRPSTRRGGAKSLETSASPKKRGTMRRGSGRRGILENANGNLKTKASARVPHANENENANVKESTRRKEKRKGLWSIYSIYSELGLSGSHRFQSQC